MAPAQTTQKNVQGEFSTAEVTDVLKAIRMDGRAYLRNHLVMKLSGNRGIVREFHDEVTKPNLDRCIDLAEKLGVDLPFPKKLEERENELKGKLQGTQIEGVITEGEGIAETYEAARTQVKFYASSMTYATHDDARECFRRCFETAADFLPRLEQALKQTDQYFPPPTAKQVEMRQTGITSRK